MERYMPTVKIKVKVSASPTMKYWLAIDQTDLTITNGESSVALSDVEEHVLIWWMVGNPGDVLSVTGSAGLTEVFSVKESKIPVGKTKGAGFRKIKVKTP
jgi:hypothetical protein